MYQTPVEYLQTYRIERSLPEILEKTGSITEIVLRHGFTGSSYYAETFKKEMGCAPGDYRKWYRREQEEECPLKTRPSDSKKRVSKDKSEQNEAEQTWKGEKAGNHRESMPAHLL